MTNAEFEIDLVTNECFALELFYTTVDTCQSLNPNGFSFSMAFIVFPLVYHEQTRELISAKKYPGILYKAIADNKDMPLGFQNRMMDMFNLSASVLSLGISTKTIVVTEDLRVLRGEKKPILKHDTQMCRDMFTGARCVGRILSETTPITAFSLLRAVV